ncbi:MAG: TetR family transcriptional regulator [Bacteroidota bacterium]|jgi:AcrR family transcriptional regulator|nr:TetR family transcriptional regulator [Bacteroidia bacterium]
MSQTKREQILDVSERLFSEKGFEGTSVRLIASEAGVNVAMISYYFGSKEKLFESLVERKVLLMRERLENLSLEIADPLERMLAIADLYLGKMIAQRPFHRIVFRELTLQQRGDAHEKIAESIYGNARMVMDTLREGIHTGRFRQVDVEVTFLNFIGMLQFIVNGSQPLIERIVGATFSDSEDALTVLRERLRAHLHDFIRHYLLPEKE